MLRITKIFKVEDIRRKLDKIENNLLSKDNENSNKFAHFSDAVFSQNISFNEKHKLKDSQIMYESNNPQHQSIIYKKKY